MCVFINVNEPQLIRDIMGINHFVLFSSHVNDFWIILKLDLDL